MADIADIGNDLEERYRQETLAVRREEGPKTTGACLYCGEPVEEGRRRCSAECRDGWQRIKANREVR